MRILLTGVTPMKPKSSNIKHLSIGIVAALILWGCGESSDSTNNAPSNINNGTDYVVLSSSQTSSILCNEGETFTDGVVNYICSNQKWVQQETMQHTFSSSSKEAWNYLNPAISYETITDNRDGKIYKIVTIGNQVWMAENLNFETPNSYCYIDVTQECMKYGRLYTWNAAMTVCPSGWHLPSQAEWEILFNAVGGKDIACKNLKSSYNWNENGFGTNLFGFSALPAGYRDGQGNYDNIGKGAYFWHSTKDNVHNAIENKDFSYVAEIRLWYENEIADIDVFSALLGENLDLGYSVRCLKDDISNTTSSSSAATISNSSNEISSSSSVKDKSSSSNKTLSSSSVSTGCKYERESRNIYFDDLYITDVCINGVWKYPSTSCEKTGPTIIETLDTIMIDGVSYTSYCYNNTLYFYKTCKEGDRDTTTQNGTLKVRVCTKYGIWAAIESFSSSSQQSSASQQSSSSISYQKCFNPKITYGQMTDSRDGHTYKTVVIGKQTWMAENLNYKSLINESEYKGQYEPLYNLDPASSKLFNCSDGIEENCDITGRSYGRIVAFDSIFYHDIYFRFDKNSPCYQYKKFNECGDQLIAYIINQKGHFQGICPSGWHIPTTDEFDELFQYTNTGKTGTGIHYDTVFKSICGWPCTESFRKCYNKGSDDFGFSLIPTKIYQSNTIIESFTSLWYINTDYLNSGHADLLHTMDFTSYYNGGTLFIRDEKYLDGLAYIRCVKD